ncbi:MAG: prepilin-type N-terminal cleavage/methylation domain-containing protein [Rhabdochlamydiaceae bacterium]|nr:prepilin-type N-terminal cleavage/methylation domain-containing protein [Candidatus Amphrikana amoebophyrae]
MKRKKHALTLLEVMVVIFIIGIIGAVIGVNMKGSLNEGKAFKSEKGSKQVYEILSLELAKYPEKVADIIANPMEAIKNSGLPQNAKKLLEDGWGERYFININEDTGDIFVTSKKYIQYLMNKKHKKKKEIEKDYPWMNLDIMRFEQKKSKVG